MRFKIATIVALSAAVLAVPAHANETRLEARGGMAWANGVEEAIAGVAVGYDFDLSDSAFLGLEASADKVLASGADVVFGVSARVGINVAEGSKLYATGGYSVTDNADFPHVGAGFQQTVAENVYVKAEFRHFFNDFSDINTAAVGVGMKF